MVLKWVRHFTPCVYVRMFTLYIRMWPDLEEGVLYSHPILQLSRGRTSCVVKLMHQNLLWHKFKDVKMFLQNCSLFTVGVHPFKVEKLDASTKPLFTNLVTYYIPLEQPWRFQFWCHEHSGCCWSYSHTLFSSIQFPHDISHHFLILPIASMLQYLWALATYTTHLCMNQRIINWSRQE